MAEKFWKLGIIGWPLGYSLSPLMHTAALKAAGLQGEYKEYPAKPEDLERWLETEAPKLDGFNVTMPHKEAVYRWLESRGKIDPFAKMAGAVNTVAVRDGKLSGHNTDGDGFWEPLKKHKPLLIKWQVLLLGAGGAARAIAAVLRLRDAAREIAVWSRRPESSQKLAQEILKGSGLRGPVAASVKDLSSFPVEKCGLVINATPSGMEGEGNVPMAVTSRLRRGQVVYDLVYEPKETELILAAQKADCKVITGDEMLAAQGAAAFEIWTKVPAAKVLPAMKKVLDDHFAARS